MRARHLGATRGGRPGQCLPGSCSAPLVNGLQPAGGARLQTCLSRGGAQGRAAGRAAGRQVHACMHRAAQSRVLARANTVCTAMRFHLPRWRMRMAACQMVIPTLNPRLRQPQQ